MKTSPLVVCVFCVSAMSATDALAGGNKPGKHGNAFGFLSVPQVPRSIGTGFTPALPASAAPAVAVPNVSAPGLRSGALGNGVGMTAPVVGGGAAAVSAPAGRGIGNSPGMMPAHAHGVAKRMGDERGLGDRDDRHLHGKAHQRGLAGKALTAPTGEAAVQSASGHSSTTSAEVAAEAAERANQLVAQGDPRQLPTCR